MRRLVRRQLLVLPAVMLLAAAAGCRSSLDADVPLYRDVLDAGTRSATRPADDAAPLRLVDALALANVGNETLPIQGEQYVRAFLNRRRAVAEFLPTATFAPSYAVREAVSGSSDAETVLDAPVELDWTIFDGGRNINRYWRDTYLRQRELNRLLEVQEALLYDVGVIYLSVQRAEAAVRVLENSLVVQDERLRDAEGRLAAGVARPLDVAQTRAQASATRVSLIEARRQVAEARSLLAYVTAAPVENRPLVEISDELLETLAIGTAQELLALAETHRSELAAAYEAVRAARRNVEVAFGQYYPSVSLNLSAFAYRESTPSARDWAAVLQVNLPIFSAGRIEADVREAWSFLREALLVDARSFRRVRQEVEQNLRDLRSSALRLDELGVQLAAAQDAFNQSQASYQAGLGTNLERVAAQDALLQAELSLVSERIDARVLRLALLRNAGVLRETLLDETGGLLPPTEP